MEKEFITKTILLLSKVNLWSTFSAQSIGMQSGQYGMSGPAMQSGMGMSSMGMSRSGMMGPGSGYGMSGGAGQGSYPMQSRVKY